MARRTGRYNDWGKTYKAFSYALLDAGKQIAADTKRDFALISEEFLDDLNGEWPHGTTITRIGWGKNNVKTRSFGGNHDHPWFTGQLHDSVAVRVADKNRTVAVRYMPPSADGGPQHTQTDRNIIGAEWAHEVAERKAPWYFLPGLQIQLIVGVPYAEKVNESIQHLGFMENLSTDLINKVDSWVESGALAKRTYIADGTMKMHKRVR